MRPQGKAADLDLSADVESLRAAPRIRLAALVVLVLGCPTGSVTGDDLIFETGFELGDFSTWSATAGAKACDGAGSMSLNAVAVDGGPGDLLVSNGIPFAPCTVRNVGTLLLEHGETEIPVYLEVLARWPDSSIRAVLLQFELAASELPATLTLSWGASRSTLDRARIDVDWTLPQAVAFPDAATLCQSRVLGDQIPSGADPRYADYDAAQAAGFLALAGDDGWTSDARDDGYYSTTLNWYLHFVRTGDPTVYAEARREAVHYRDDQIVDTGDDAGTMNGRSEPRYLYLRAMEADYLLNGDPRTLEIAGLMAQYLLDIADPEDFFYAQDAESFWTERRYASILLGLIVYGRMSGDQQYLEAAHPRFDKLVATQAEWPDGGFIHHLYAHDPDECPTFGAYGGSPFMTGLLFEALIAYYEQFGDSRVPASIVAAVDWLYDSGWYGTGFSYLIGCGYGSADEAPDLNLMIVAGFAFAHWATGEATYRMRGLEVFDAGVANAYLGARKQFNQNYRSSGWFLGYLARPSS